MHTDDVLWTKLHVPQVPSTLVDRPRLADRLARALDRPGIALLSAPAGSGKSVLLAEACRRRSGPVAWMSVDEHDNDPVRFWRHVAASLDVALGDGSAVLDALDRPTGASGQNGVDRVVAALVNALAVEGAIDVAIVLDDYHLIDDTDVHASLRFLLDHAPPTLHVAIATRADPPLDLPRWRARARLVEIRAADLRFTADEGGDLLQHVTGLLMPDHVAAALTERTEGWAAGLQLAGLSLEGRDDVESFAASFGGDHRFVLDYLTEEVLHRQDPSVRSFLLETSILDRLAGPLCDAVTGRDDGQETLEAIERLNLFVTPLDDIRGWWRYHHLFADLLRVRLRQRPEDDVAGLHRRAADWYEAAGDVNSAVRHALEAGETRRAARLIEHHADELLLRREGATLQRWFRRFPPGHLDSRRLVLAQARTAIYGGRIAEAENLLDRADELTGEPDEAVVDGTPAEVPGPLSTPEPTASLLRAFVAHLRGDADLAVSLAAPLVDEFDDATMIGLIARWHLAAAPWLRGAVREAEPALAANIAAWRRIGEHDRAAWSARYLGQIQVAQARLDDALATYEEVLALDADLTEADSPAAGVAHVGIAEIAYERNELDVARLHARLGVSKCEDFISTQALADGWTLLARIAQASGDPVAAGQASHAATEVAPTGDVVDLLDPVRARLAHLALLRGDVVTADAWAEAHGFVEPIEADHVREPAELTFARLLVTQRRSDQALHRLGVLRPRAVDDGRDGSVIEIDIVCALAYAAEGDDAQAHRALAEAVRRAARPRHVRVFADEGEPMARLLESLLVARPDLEPAYVGALVGACRSDEPPGGAGPSQAGLVVPLTERELEVLVEIADGRTNKDIAADLFISLNTVKKHVTHIFDKLGVTNRTAAVARASALGLVADRTAH